MSYVVAGWLARVIRKNETIAPEGVAPHVGCFWDSNVSVCWKKKKEKTLPTLQPLQGPTSWCLPLLCKLFRIVSWDC